MQKAVIIAEACCNHMGNIKIAKRMILSAKKNGADYIKFQKRDIDTWVDRKPIIYKSSHPNQKNSFGNTYEEHRRFLEFDIETHKTLKKYCDDIGLKYACSVFDIVSAKEILKLSPSIIKIPSACNLNFDLIEYICKNYNGEIHISTGMTSKKDIDKIVKIFIKENKNKFLVLYACTSSYPLDLSNICLLEISYLIKKYGKIIKSIGYSGHHSGILVDIAAYTLGSTYIERHYTLNRKYKGTDQKASINPIELRKLRQNLDEIKLTLTEKNKEILDVELSNKEKLKW